jgi:hypothetical protein
MIEAQLGLGKFLPAILTRAFIAKVNVEPGKSNGTFGHAIVSNEKDNLGHPDHPVYQPDSLVFFNDFEITPRFEVKGFVLSVHGAGNAAIQKTERSARRRHVNRKKGPIENQNSGVDHSTLEMEKETPGETVSQRQPRPARINRHSAPPGVNQSPPAAQAASTKASIINVSQGLLK